MSFVCCSLICLVVIEILVHSNNRCGLFLNHNLIVPKSAHNVEFGSYRNFLCIDGDGSVAYFTLPRKDFEAFIKQQRYCYNCYGAGPFQKFPDSLMDKYPIRVECEAPKGDVLIITADSIWNDTELRIGLYTDWN